MFCIATGSATDRLFIYTELSWLFRLAVELASDQRTNVIQFRRAIPDFVFMPTYTAEPYSNNHFRV